MASSLPSARTLPSRTATACARGCSGSSVTIAASRSTRSAAGSFGGKPAIGASAAEAIAITASTAAGNQRHVGLIAVPRESWRGQDSAPAGGITASTPRPAPRAAAACSLGKCIERRVSGPLLQRAISLAYPCCVSPNPFTRRDHMSLRNLLLTLCTSLLALTTGAADKPAAPTTSYLLKADRIFDARSEQTHAGWAVLVQGDRIAAIGPADQIKAPAAARVIDMPGATLMPGMIDAHSHIFLHPYNETLWNDQVLKEPLAYRTIEAVNHVRDTLMAGFTALRDLGTEGAGYSDVDVQRAIDNGLIPGPHLFVATRATVAEDCYGPGPLGFRENLALPQGGIPVAGVPEMIAAVRDQAGHGADWIKIYADYHCGKSHGSVPTF